MAESIVFPWLKHLPEDAQREFFEELSDTIGQAQLHSTPGVLVSPETYVKHLDPLITAWRATAEVHADPVLYRALTAQHDLEGDFEEVPRPVPCPSNTPDDRRADAAHWCVLAPGHLAKFHLSDEGFRWTDKDAEERNPGRKLLDCGLCFLEQGEEVHPHPECTVRSQGQPDAFDQVVPPTFTQEEAEAYLKSLYGGDWSRHLTVLPEGDDSVKAVLPEQRSGEADCG